MLPEWAAKALARIPELEKENAELRRDNARYENARLVLTIENDHLRRQLGHDNTHPDADKCPCCA